MGNFIQILKFKSNWKRARVSKWTLIPPESPHLGEPVNEVTVVDQYWGSVLVWIYKVMRILS